MEVCLPARCRVSGRTAGRDDCIQDTTGALGQGTNPDGKENPSPRAEERCSTAHQDRGLVPSHFQSELSPDGRPFRVALAGHGHPFLPGMVPDALHRSATVYGVDFLDFQFLFGFTKRIVSRQMVPVTPVLAFPYGSGNRTHDYEYTSCAGSPPRQADRLCSYPQIPRRISQRQGALYQVPPSPGMGALGGVAGRQLFRLDGLLCDRQRKLHHRAVSRVVCCRVLVHRPHVSPAGTVLWALARSGNPYEAISRRRLEPQLLLCLSEQLAPHEKTSDVLFLHKVV